MDELITYYKAYLESLNKSSHTVKQYGIDIQQFIKFMKDHDYSFDGSISKIIEEYNQYLLEAFSSFASVNRKKASLHHFLSFLRQRNRIEEVPESLLKPIKTEKESIQTLSNDQVTMASHYWMEDYETATDIEYKWITLRNFCIVNIIIEIGLKPSELVSMKWSHIQGNEMTILQNKRIRKLPLSKSFLNWLTAYRIETESLLPYSKEGEYVWLGLGNKQNVPITVKTIERIFKTLTNKLGFKVTATALRYTLINTDTKKYHAEQLQDIYVRYGYARKSVLKERLELIKKSGLPH